MLGREDTCGRSDIAVMLSGDNRPFVYLSCFPLPLSDFAEAVLMSAILEYRFNNFPT